MLIQLPSGSPEPQGPQNADQESTTFEAGLRRDLASSPIVSYDSVLGGAAKRAVDLTIALITTPVWAPLLLLAAGWSKLRDQSPVFLTDERIGNRFEHEGERLSRSIGGDGYLGRSRHDTDWSICRR